MNLAVFDLDGTLTQTAAVDEVCFVQAVNTCLGIAEISTDWSSYEHATDADVIETICLQNFGRPPLVDEVATVKNCFRDLLAAAHRESAQSFVAVAGAAALLDRLKNTGEWRAAIATGGWLPSATLKLQSAGLPMQDIPAAFAEDGPSREAIVRTAIARACSTYAQPGFERVVSIGDAVWDVLTAKRLGLPFIGIAQGSRAAALRSSGASHVIDDFRSQQAFFQCLDAASPPQ